jgi:hypothetical protein
MAVVAIGIVARDSEQPGGKGPSLRAVIADVRQGLLKGLGRQVVADLRVGAVVSEVGIDAREIAVIERQDGSTFWAARFTPEARPAPAACGACTPGGPRVPSR